MNAEKPTIAEKFDRLFHTSPELAGRELYQLFSEPTVRTQLRPAEQEVQDQAVKTTITVADTPIAIYRWGDGTKPVLLMHGYQGRSANFAMLIPGLLARGMSPIAFDTFGHGESGGRFALITKNTAVARELQQEYGVFHAAVGHSIGGTCLYYGARAGIKADRLVSISAWCDFGAVPDAFCAYHQLSPALYGELRRQIELSYLPEKDIWERLSASYRPAEIGRPVLVIHDKDDREVPVAQADKIAASFGDRAVLKITSKLGHRRILADKDVCSAILDFLSE